MVTLTCARAARPLSLGSGHGHARQAPCCRAAFAAPTTRLLVAKGRPAFVPCAAAPRTRELPARPLLNEDITQAEVRVLGEDRESLGILPIARALELAREREVDLILTVPEARPPLCRLMELSKYMYEQAKAAKQAKRKQRDGTVETKELKFRPATDIHDYNTKIRAAQRFLSKGDRVKITMQFRGREVEAGTDDATPMFERLTADLRSCGVPDAAPRRQGRTMVMLLSPKKP